MKIFEGNEYEIIFTERELLNLSKLLKRVDVGAGTQHLDIEWSKVKNQLLAKIMRPIDEEYNNVNDK